MKFFLIPMLLAGAGAGWFGLRPSASSEGSNESSTVARNMDCPPACDTEDCRVTVECTANDTCLVTCYDADDEVVCQREIACVKPCDKPCEASAPAAPTQTAKPTCAPGACKR